MIPPREYRQLQVVTWGVKAFGAEQVFSLPQRGVRLMEEAIELAQACKCDKEQLHKLIDYVYARPVGSVFGELGGVGVCVLALASAANVSADVAEQAELHRILSKPVEHFTARNQAKNDAGFLAKGDTDDHRREGS